MNSDSSFYVSNLFSISAIYSVVCQKIDGRNKFTDIIGYETEK
jgi:hypothetical protein